MNKSQHYPFELSEDDHFSIIEKYFMERGPVYHQYEGYEYMVNHSIQKIFDECNSIEIDLKTSFYRATFGQIYFEKASIIDENRKIKYITPYEARLRDITYEYGGLVSKQSVKLVDLLHTVPDDEQIAYMDWNIELFRNYVTGE